MAFTEVRGRTEGGKGRERRKARVREEFLFPKLFKGCSENPCSIWVGVAAELCGQLKLGTLPPRDPLCNLVAFILQLTLLL